MRRHINQAYRNTIHSLSFRDKFSLLNRKEVNDMKKVELKGYPVPAGYMGILPSGAKLLFSTEEEYVEYMKEHYEKED